MTARERIEGLLDPDSFVEPDALVRHRRRDFGIQPADLRRGRPGHQRRREGRPLHPYMRFLPHPGADFRGCARLPARHRPGAGRHHPARSQTAVRVRGGHRPKWSPWSPARHTAVVTVSWAPSTLGTDINLAWPTAEIAVMGAKGAVSVLHREALRQCADPQAEQERLCAEYEATLCNPYIAAEHGYIDAAPASAPGTLATPSDRPRPRPGRSRCSPDCRTRRTSAQPWWSAKRQGPGGAGGRTRPMPRYCCHAGRHCPVAP
jgi:hypothetical protein